MSAPPADDVRSIIDQIVGLLAPDQGSGLTPEDRRLFGLACRAQSMLAAVPALSTSPNGQGEAWRPGREEIARIISPSSWAFYDRHVSAPAMRAEVNHQVSFSLADADAILALQPPALEGDHG